MTTFSDLTPAPPDDDVDLTLPDFLVRRPLPPVPVAPLTVPRPVVPTSDGPAYPAAREWVMPEPTDHMAPGVRDMAMLHVVSLVRQGHDTFGKIKRAAPGVRHKVLKSSLRAAIRAGLVRKQERRYYARER